MNFKFKKNLVYLVVIAMAIIELAFPFPIFKVYPSLILALGLSYILLNNLRYSLIWLLFGGLILDLVSPARFGWITLSYVIAAAPLYYLVTKIIRTPALWVVFFGIFIPSVISEFLLNIFLKIPQNLGIFIFATQNCFIGLIFFSIAKIYSKKSELIKLY